MFQRRKKQAVFRRLKGFVWPEMGWRRLWRYVAFRIVRLPGSPRDIAAGFACGAAVSFTPLIGLHFILGMVLARLIGANIVAALIGTIIGNPWTFPFIWVWSYKLGIWLGGGPAMEPEQGIGALMPNIWEAIIRFDVQFLVAEAWPILSPMLIGGAVTAAAVWILVFLLLKRVLDIYENRRAARRGEKSMRMAEHET